MENPLAHAKALDRADPFQAVGNRFYLPEGQIYLNGNSLGAMPKAALETANKTTAQEWGQDLIKSWNKAGWFELPTTYGDRLAPLIGAGLGEVVVCDSTSINLYKALFAGLSLCPERHVVLAEAGSFPTDLYMLEGAASQRPGLNIRLAKNDILGEIDETVAVVLINHVDYRTGKLADMGRITKRAHEAGAVVIWDLCHSAGIFPVALGQHNVDLAIGCTYKYLNGGPGAPAFLYCAKRHLPHVSQPLSGWWGHARPFAFETGFEGDTGIRKFLCGTQPILSFRVLEAGLDIFSGLDMTALRAKSQSLSSLFIARIKADIPELKLTSPHEADARGAQVSFTHPEAYAVMQALIERGVIGDFRAPDVLRFGLSPLYLSHEDIIKAVAILQDILASGIWQQPRFQRRERVT
ncbi:MAG: kynureninase [Rhodobacteraceae bacterium]|nr:kynureninase [Paracoccaceae bacterium]